MKNLKHVMSLYVSNVTIFVLVEKCQCVFNCSETAVGGASATPSGEKGVVFW